MPIGSDMVMDIVPEAPVSAALVIGIERIEESRGAPVCADKDPVAMMTASVTPNAAECR